MLRVLAMVFLVPGLLLLAWAGLRTAPTRADFVFAATEPRTLDPQRVSWLPEIQLANALFEGLTRLDPATYQPGPAVAAQWQVAPDQTAWTFTLRPDAAWSNGEPVTAEHFRFAWLRVLDPRVAAQYASLLFVIRGAEAYYRSRLDPDLDNDLPAAVVGIEAPEPRTLRVHLARPCAYFLDLAAFPTFFPLHPPTLERWAYRDGRVLPRTQHLWTRPGHMVGNGAFVLADWRFKQSILLRRNPHYWDADAIALDSLEACITSDPNAALLAYETGRADLVRGLETSVARRLMAEQQAGRRPDFHLGDRFATFFFRVNCTRPPLDEPDFRRALALAVDRQAICEHVLGLGEAPADTYVPRAAAARMARPAAAGGTVLYAPPAGLGAGLSYRARAELAQEYLDRYRQRRGLTADQAIRPIELAFPPEPELRRIGEAVQQMWERVLGLRIELRTLEAKVLSTRIRELDYDLARSDWFGDYLDPATFLNMFASGDGQNRTGWSCPAYDRLIAAAADEPDNARRYAALAAAERILCEEELPIIPIFFRRGNFLLNPRFGGVADHILDRLPVHRVRRQEGTNARRG